MKKEELRNDPVRENIVRGIEYIKEHQNIALITLIVIGILVAGYSYYNHIGTINIGNASHIAGLAQNTFINGDIDEAMVKFERVLIDYPKTSGATQSLVYLLNDAVNKENYESVSSLIKKYKGGIDEIDDPIVKSTIYKIQGDMALVDGKSDAAIDYYRKAEHVSIGNIRKAKYKLDIITALLIKGKYSDALNIIEDILNIDDLGYIEKNKAEELLAFMNYKLGT